MSRLRYDRSGRGSVLLSGVRALGEIDVHIDLETALEKL